MTKLEQIVKISKSSCACSCADCILTDICGRDPKEVALSLLDLLSYDSDLSKCEVGDWVWEQETGKWSKIQSIEHTSEYPIRTSHDAYTLKGKIYKSNKFPTLFIKPPLCFNPEPKPEPVCHFKRGDRVIISNRPKTS